MACDYDSETLYLFLAEWILIRPRARSNEKGTMKKKTNKILDVYNGQLRSKSGQKSVAQSLGMCNPPTVEIRNIITLMSELELKKNQSIPEYCIFEIQLFSGCRISEALRITQRDVNIFGTVIIKGSKKSGNKTVNIVHTRDFLLKRAKHNYHIFQDVDRFRMYRWYKKKGIYINRGKNKNKAVTHALRYVYINYISQMTGDKSLTAELTRHKNIKSQDYYIK